MILIVCLGQLGHPPNFVLRFPVVVVEAASAAGCLRGVDAEEVHQLLVLQDDVLASVDHEAVCIFCVLLGVATLQRIEEAHVVALPK